MSNQDLIQLAIAYSDSVNSIIGMLCAIFAEYVINRIQNASQRD